MIAPLVAQLAIADGSDFDMAGTFLGVVLLLASTVVLGLQLQRMNNVARAVIVAGSSRPARTPPTAGDDDETRYPVVDVTLLLAHRPNFDLEDFLAVVRTRVVEGLTARPHGDLPPATFTASAAEDVRTAPKDFAHTVAVTIVDHRVTRAWADASWTTLEVALVVWSDEMHTQGPRTFERRERWTLQQPTPSPDAPWKVLKTVDARRVLAGPPAPLHDRYEPPSRRRPTAKGPQLEERLAALCAREGLDTADLVAEVRALFGAVLVAIRDPTAKAPCSAAGSIHLDGEAHPFRAFGLVRDRGDGHDIKAVEFAHVEDDGVSDTLVVRIEALVPDCTRDATGAVVSGSEQAQPVSEYWTLRRVRAPGAQLQFVRRESEESVLTRGG